MADISKEFEYTATGVNTDGEEVKFGGTADTLQDAIGGVFGHDDEGVVIHSWTADQYAEYWEILVSGTKGGKDETDVRYTLEEPKKSATFVAGLAIGFDQVLRVRVTYKRVKRGELDHLLSRKEAWL